MKTYTIKLRILKNNSVKMSVKDKTRAKYRDFIITNQQDGGLRMLIKLLGFLLTKEGNVPCLVQK